MKVRAGDNSRRDNSRRMVLLIYIPFSTHSPRIPRRQKIKPPPSILQRPGNHRAFSPRRSYALAIKKRRGTELNNKTETHKKMEGGQNIKRKKKAKEGDGWGRGYGKREKEEKSEKKFTRTQFRVSRVSAGNVWPWLWRSRWRNRYRRGGGLLFAYVARGGGGRDGWRRRRKAGFNAHASCIFKPPARYSCTRKLNPNARLRRWPLQPPLNTPSPLYLCLSSETKPLLVYVSTQLYSRVRT